MTTARHACGSCRQVARRDYWCPRCRSDEAFAWHPDSSHLEAELRCIHCNAVPPGLQPRERPAERAA
jgi:hypothetical protein